MAAPAATSDTGAKTARGRSSSARSKKAMRRTRLVWTAIGGSLGVVFSGAAAPVIQHWLAPASAPVAVAAAEPASLDVTTLSRSGANPVTVTSSTTAEVRVAGTVHGTLQGGQTIFVLWRGMNSEASKDATVGTLYSGLPCVVHGHAFSCDPPTLGSRPSSGVSLVWVGIANSQATKLLVESYRLQSQFGHDGDGPQPEPNGFRVHSKFQLQWGDI